METVSVNSPVSIPINYAQSLASKFQIITENFLRKWKKERRKL